VKNRLVAFGIDTSYCCLFTLWFVDNNRSSASEKSVLDMSLYSSTISMSIYISMSLYSSSADHQQHQLTQHFSTSIEHTYLKFMMPVYNYHSSNSKNYIQLQVFMQCMK
jgi:hypothetical protein